MGKIEELKAKYEAALERENDFRENQYKPIQNELYLFCDETKAILEQLEEAQLEEFENSFEGNFLDADWTKLDMEWLLYSDATGRGKKVYDYQEELFKSIRAIRGNGYFSATNQIGFSVSMPKDADEAEIEEAASIIEKLLPHLKPLEDYRAVFDVFEDDLCETRHPVLSTVDEKEWIVKNVRWNGIYYTGTLRSCLRYIGQNFYYTFY